MTHRTHTTNGSSKARGRRGLLPLAAVSIALMAGCGVPADASDRGIEGRDLAPTEPAREGTVRKVAAEWYEFSDGEWSERSQPVRSWEDVTAHCGPSTRKCFVPTP
jgi:hypothetical protein